MNAPKTPELDKISKVSDKSQAIGEFLEWLVQKKEIVLAKWMDMEGWDPQLVVAYEPKNKLLAEYFGIDQDKVENERRKLLEYAAHLSQK